MNWGLRERTGLGPFSWSRKDFAVTVLLEEDRYLCKNTLGITKEGTFAEVSSGCRDITN
jgi:hypothetical protein